MYCFSRSLPILRRKMDAQQKAPLRHFAISSPFLSSPNVSVSTNLACCRISRKAALLRNCSCCLLFLLLALQTHTSEGRRLYGSSSSNSVSSTTTGSRDRDNIAMCFFRTGDAVRDDKLTPFYVPENDKHMYEEGVRDYLQKMGAPAEQLSVVCEELKGNKDVKCELCLYNEISADQKHVRQGQVIDAMLLQCMRGIFDQAAVMNKSHYYPICYPRPRQRVARELVTQCEQSETANAAGPSSAVPASDRRHSQQHETQQNDGRARSATGQDDATREQTRHEC